MEVLKDKMKEKIIASNGKKLDQIAATVTEANNERWKHKMAAKRLCEEFKQKIHAAFSSQ